MKKLELRNIYKEKRKKLSHHSIDKFNDLILINFQKIHLQFINCVHTYLPSLKLAEPDTERIIRYLTFKNPSLKIVIPKIDIHSGNMTHYHFDEETVMVKNSLGIDEPKDGEIISEKEIDLALIPLLAFDKKGYRVGYGKGYYDKFLSRCKPDIIKIGISFFEAGEEIEDINSFDIPLNYCVTTQRLYVF
jgi:5-formyltetrahydrofolate cyclo-ligase